MTKTPQLTMREILPVFARIGLLSFGGPAGQIALMHRVLVEERKWMDEDSYLHALNFCMLLPGPEAMQLATYAGWRLRGWPGGLAAGLLFVLPGAAVIMLLAALYVTFGTLPAVAALFYGLKPAVLIIVIEALLRVGKRALKKSSAAAVAALAFLALFVAGIPFPAVIAAAALWGYAETSAKPEGAGPPPEAPPLSRSLRTIATWLLIWAAPVTIIFAALGPDHVLAELAVFFSKLAVVTFGGAYAVLAYMAQQAVEQHHWLSAREMLDALGLAETTPGPLILVTEFVGFIAGYRAMGGLAGGMLGALVTLWVTFAPCFLWIFAGAPYIELLRQRPRLSGALAAITAAVVGVIANLALWFALHVIFTAQTAVEAPFGRKLIFPVPASLDITALVLTALAALLLFRTRLGLLGTLGVTALAGAAVKLAF